MATLSVSSASVKQDIFTFRIIKLILEYGSIVYRTCLETRAKNTKGTLQEHLKNKKSVIERQSKGVISQKQLEKIFPHGQAVTTVDDFDITLLAFLIRNTCPCEHQNNADEEKKWRQNKIEDLPVNDLSETSDLVRIRIFRNQIAHFETTEKYDEPTFDDKWQEIAEVLIRRCPNLKSGIDKLKLCAIDTDLQIELEQLKCQMNEWEQVAAQLNDHDQQLYAHSDKLGALHQRVNCLETKVLPMRRDHIQQAGPLVSMDIAQIGHIPAPRTSVPQLPLTVLQCDLINHYRKELSQLPLSPLNFGEEGYAANLIDFYVKPNITILSHQGPKGQSGSKPVLVHDIFSSQHCQNIYISSPAGCGKTSFAKYLALMWCQAHQPVKPDNQWILTENINEMRTFTFLFIVFLRLEHERECDVDIMIQNQLLSNLAHSATYTELGVKFVQNLLSNVKCFIILDGLDEWSHPAGNMCKLKNKNIPHNRARLLCTTLTTSRPWKLDDVKLKSEDIDQMLELNGLEEDLLIDLISKVVDKLNELHGKKMDADHFVQELKKNKLTDLSKIPVVVMQLLTVWFDNKPLGKSRCEIYSNMIKFLLERYCKTKEIVSEIEDMEVDGCSIGRQIPMCLQNNKYCKVHMELLLKLATLAYNTLFTDNEESSLVFDRKIVKKYLNTDKEIEMCLAVGILTQEKVLGKSSIRQSHISFIHKTFQEYLAALYIALNPGMKTRVKEKIKHVCFSIEKLLDMSQIFMFLSGLCPEVMVDLHKHLRQTLSKDSRTQRYRASGEVKPLVSDEAWTLERVQYNMVEWLGECWLNGHKHVTHLPVSDFFIRRSSQWSAELKSLTVHNPVCSLYIRDDAYSPERLEEILNSVTVFNSIQKLWMTYASETCVVLLVTQHRHSFSVSPKTWRHLGWVTLWLVRISGDILCSLVDSILQLPKSVQVRLEDCDIQEKIRDWKEYIRFHRRLTVDVVENSWSYVQLLQFHTNKVHFCCFTI